MHYRMHCNIEINVGACCMWVCLCLMCYHVIIVIMLCLDRTDFLPLYTICSQSMMVELIAVHEYHSYADWLPF